MDRNRWVVRGTGHMGRVVVNPSVGRCVDEGAGAYVPRGTDLGYFESVGSVTSTEIETGPGSGES